MPLYEYGCEACGHRFEIQQKLAEAPLSLCPACSKESLQKIISAAAFVLKGGGWYKDGYGSGKGPERTEKQVTDSLQNAVDKDKAKSAESTPAPAASTPAASTPAAPASGGGDSKASAAHS